MPRVLIVEPDIELLNTVGKYFQKNNYEVDLCEDAQKAVLSADKNRPSVVVLELAMAKNNGLAFLQEFRSYDDWKQIPVIIYSQIPREDTGLSDADWQKQNIETYLYKPTKSLANLVAAVEAVV